MHTATDLQRLEPRMVLSTTPITLHDHVLMVTGNAMAGNEVGITLVGKTHKGKFIAPSVRATIERRKHPEEFADFALSAVNGIRITGGSSSDIITVVPAAKGIAPGIALRIAIAGGSGDDRIDVSGLSRLSDVNAVETTLSGGAGNDWIVGSDGRDIIEGGGGDDLLDGREGNDSISGGTGDDVLIGRGGNDTLTGFIGNDTLVGGAGNDLLYGGDGNDDVDGSSVQRVKGEIRRRDDLASDEGHTDTLYGGSGDDILHLGNDDHYRTDSGNDQLPRL